MLDGTSLADQVCKVCASANTRQKQREGANGEEGKEVKDGEGAHSKVSVPCHAYGEKINEPNRLKIAFSIRYF